MDKLKNKMATAPILIFPNWKKEFYVHVDVSYVVLNIVLTQPREGALDQISLSENYTKCPRYAFC